MGSLQTYTDWDSHRVNMSASVVVNANTSCIMIPGDNHNSNSGTELFPSSLLMDLDLGSCQAKFEPPLGVKNPGEGLKVRPLCLEDYDRGFLQLLGQLTSVGDIPREQWQQRWEEMKNCNSTYYVIVMERKFIHSCGSVGRLEDVVVSDVYRGKQLCKLVVSTATLLAVKLGCYKVTLNCNDKMIKFYSSIGYKSEDGNSNYMCIRV